jgi:hypothetical protein
MGDFCALKLNRKHAISDNGTSIEWLKLTEGEA